MSSLLFYIATFRVRIYKNLFINTLEALTYFNIIILCHFTWYTVDVGTKQRAVTNVSVIITCIQLIAVIIYHIYKHMNQKLFTVIQESAICITVKEILTPKMQKNISHKLVSYDEDIHELLDMIGDSVNTSDCHTPQEPAKPTHSFVDLLKPPAASPPVETIKEELENESSQQACEEESSNVISVEENLRAENMQCINYLSSTIPKETKPDSNLQINNSHSDTEKRAMELPQLDNMDQSLDVQKVPSLLATSDKQKGVSSNCITVKAEIHNS